jgi:hypothetical protein
MRDTADLEDLTKAQLVDYANRAKVPVKAQWSKGDIIDAILEAEEAAPAPVSPQDHLGHPGQPGVPPG